MRLCNAARCERSRLQSHALRRALYHCKNIRISTNILWRVSTLQCGLRGLRYSGDLRIQTEPVLLEYGKLATKHPWIYGYFYSVRRRAHAPRR